MAGRAGLRLGYAPSRLSCRFLPALVRLLPGSIKASARFLRTSMSLIFVYGSLKAGFQNAHVNQGLRQPGAFRTRQRYPLLLLGDYHVPCLVLQPGTGHQVSGEVYEVSADALARMDKLERLHEPLGYRRVGIEVERTDSKADGGAAGQGGAVRVLSVEVYAKPPAHVSLDEPRGGPLTEYTAEQAARFKW